MIVFGVEITQAQKDACYAAMEGSFQAVDIQIAAKRAGVIGHRIIYGLSYRLLTKQAKAGKIIFNGKTWRLVE